MLLSHVCWPSTDLIQHQHGAITADRGRRQPCLHVRVRAPAHRGGSARGKHGTPGQDHRPGGRAAYLLVIVILILAGWGGQGL